MTLMNKLLASAVILGGIAIAATPALAYPARSEAGVNVRSGPGTQYDVVGQLSPGERVNVNSCNGGWCRVSSEGGDAGWVSGNYLTASAGYTAPAYDNYYDSPYYDDGYVGPPVSFGFSFGTGHGWHGGHRWHH